jgi:hypothetical protein
MRSLADRLDQSERIHIGAIAPSWTSTGMLSDQVAQCVPTQNARTVALSIAWLALHPETNGQVIYSASGSYREIELPILSYTRKLLGVEKSEGELAIELSKRGALE